MSNFSLFISISLTKQPLLVISRNVLVFVQRIVSLLTIYLPARIRKFDYLI